MILHGVLWTSRSGGRARDPARRRRLGHRFAGLLAARTSFCTKTATLQQQEVPLDGNMQRFYPPNRHRASVLSVLLWPSPRGTALSIWLVPWLRANS